MAVLVFLPDREDGSGAVLAGLSVFAAAALALSVVTRVRPLPQRSAPEHRRLVLSAAVLGVGVGLANLLANFAMASFDAAIREQMVTRWAEFSAWSMVLAEPIIEEIAYRLVLMTLVAWLISRFTSNRRSIEVLALAIPAVLFGVAHVFYGGVDSLPYAVGIAVKSSALGVPCGLLFWRWGLPHSMLAHCVANGTHLLLMPAFF